MMGWDSFIYFAVVAALLWTAGALAAWRGRRNAALAASACGLLAIAIFIGLLWISLERPPLRTMGETRLWYSAFLSLAGILVYGRWKYNWILSFSTLLALVFMLIDLLRPEIQSKTLMPALQSPWFAPHVIVYMFCYAILGAATLMAIAALVNEKRHFADSDRLLLQIDNLVYVGYAFMTLGMLMGALWANEAWGNYWAWDPKETWAAATWLCYLAYMHFRLSSPEGKRTAMWLLIIAFCCLQMCWWGIDCLPTARAASVHVY